MDHPRVLKGEYGYVQFMCNGMFWRFGMTTFNEQETATPFDVTRSTNIKYAYTLSYFHKGQSCDVGFHIFRNILAINAIETYHISAITCNV